MRMYYRMNKKGKLDTQSPWIDKMIHCIQRSAYFNTHRMMKEYHDQMWSFKESEA